MPIRISNSDTREEIAWLCDDAWDLPSQIDELDRWLKEKNELKNHDYIADLGFSPRSDAAGGGAVITTDMMQRMVRLGIDLYLSEYPPLENKDHNQSMEEQPIQPPRD